MARAFIFPGQGSQCTGMGKSLAEAFPEARDVFEIVNESLKQDLTKIMFENPDGQLDLTENTQPALMAVSMAVMEVLRRQGKIDLSESCKFVAGHSLGEYSALTAARAFDISETARLLKMRGQFMQKAVPVGIGAMAAILGLDMEAVQAVAKEASQPGSMCQAANDNSVGQVVISGHKEAIERAVVLATERGAKKAVMLQMSVPAHSQLMAPAAEAMAETLAAALIHEPMVPVVANVTAQAIVDPTQIRTLLVDQITGMVRWRESVIWMKEQGITEMVEIGSGKVLAGLVKRIDKDIACESVCEPQQVEDLIIRLNK